FLFAVLEANLRELLELKLLVVLVLERAKLVRKVPDLDLGGLAQAGRLLSDPPLVVDEIEVGAADDLLLPVGKAVVQQHLEPAEGVFGVREGGRRDEQKEKEEEEKSTCRRSDDAPKRTVSDQGDGSSRARIAPRRSGSCCLPDPREGGRTRGPPSDHPRCTPRSPHRRRTPQSSG